MIRGNMSNDEAFITAVHLATLQADPLADVRLEQSRLLEVVAQFSVKVEKLVDKQRTDFIEAYETHMQHVQRDLLVLRNKAVSIDKNFREEKLKRIQAEEEKYRDESLRLDQVVLRESELLKASVKTMTALQNEVDWLLKRLEQERRKHHRLTSMQAARPLGQDSLFSDSASRAVHIEPERRRRPLQTEPSGYKFPADEWPFPMSSQPIGKSRSLQSLPLAAQQRTRPAAKSPQQQSKHALQQLVSRRSIQSEVIDFLRQAEMQCVRERRLRSPPETDFSRELQMLLEATLEQAAMNKEGRARREELLRELMTRPELYEAIAQCILDSRLAYENYSVATESRPASPGASAEILMKEESRAVPQGQSNLVDPDILEYLAASSSTRKNTSEKK